MDFRSVSSYPQSVPYGDFDLPPVICSNTREKIKGEEVSVTQLADALEKKHVRDTSVTWVSPPTTPLQPTPRYSLTIAWDPPSVCFDLNEEAVVKQLMVQNKNPRSIYIQCCGLWDSTAKLGASWKSYPHTRFLLAPGLIAVVSVRATPREYPSPCSTANLNLQLAASHMRDNVTGYFMVPIQVNFQKYFNPMQDGAE